MTVSALTVGCGLTETGFFKMFANSDRKRRVAPARYGIGETCVYWILQDKKGPVSRKEKSSSHCVTLVLDFFRSTLGLVHPHLCCWTLQMVIQMTGLQLNRKCLCLNCDLLVTLHCFLSVKKEYQ